MFVRANGFLSAKEMPEHLYEPVKILDHGYMHLVDHMGHDERIIEAARMSTDKGFVSWEPYEGHPRGDEGLLEYLYKNKHGTPFEMCELCIVVQAPILVFREWHRHRTQSYNEMSARYTPLPNLNYIPSVERLMINAGGSNKQAGTIKGAEVLTEAAALAFQDKLKAKYADDESVYQWALASGVPKELARVHLPVGRYSRMMAKTDLRNWLAFMTLRSAPTAQWEIRQYSLRVGEYIREMFPRTYNLFVENPPWGK
jgi:thymidylate synthase (FAD)